MKFEIERKFLIRNNDWEKLATRHLQIRQVYLDDNPKISIRVRITDNNKATLSFKSRPSSMRRLELEYPIPMLEAEALMPLRHGQIIEKIRYIVPHGELAWEIDRFSGENLGLMIAEIELPDEHHPVQLPSWIGPEVTGQSQYYNGSLAQRPFCSWTKRETTAIAPAG